jgi:signal recognition particle receptor subunit beta
MSYSSTQDPKTNLIYLYDLPKEEISSTKIAMIFKDQAGVVLDSRPQIRKDITKPFYSGIVNIKDPIQFQIACQKMRYFEIDGKPCRAL